MGKTGDSAVTGDPRGKYLDALLWQLRSRAVSLRQYVGEATQNHALGLAAEKGVRDVLRNVLPNRVGISSGFMCDADGSLIASAVDKESLSPQTDVLLYDASYACPLYRMDEIEVVAAADAHGLVEVKDNKDGEDMLREGGGGALAHVARLSAPAPQAFRAIVLFRSKTRAQKLGAESAYYQCEQACKPGPLRLTSSTVPHVIYCVDRGYLAVYEYTTNKLHFFADAPDEPTSALADFLRITTSVFAARGLTSPSFSAGLSRGSEAREPALELQLPDRDELASLQRMVNEVSLSPEGGAPSFTKRLKHFLETRVEALHCFPTTGRDERGEFFGGLVVAARLKDPAENAASFFVVDRQGLRCVDRRPSDPASAPSPEPWIIGHERPEIYFRRLAEVEVSTQPFKLDKEQ